MQQVYGYQCPLVHIRTLIPSAGQGEGLFVDCPPKPRIAREQTDLLSWVFPAGWNRFHSGKRCVAVAAGKLTALVNRQGSLSSRRSANGVSEKRAIAVGSCQVGSIIGRCNIELLCMSQPPNIHCSTTGGLSNRGDHGTSSTPR